MLYLAVTMPTRPLADLDRKLREDPEYVAALEERAPYEAIARQLIAFRIEHDLSQTELAERCGVSQPAIARLERGEHVRDLRRSGGLPMRSTQISCSTSASRKAAGGSTWPRSDGWAVTDHSTAASGASSSQNSAAQIVSRKKRRNPSCPSRLKANGQGSQNVTGAS